MTLYDFMSLYNGMKMFCFQDDPHRHHLCNSGQNTWRGRPGTGDVAAGVVHRHDRDRCVSLSAGDHAADICGLR